jgi:tRNA threonylcarbamoyladenosine biosynthesis protein TsaB
LIRLCLDAATSTTVLGLFRDGQELSARRMPGARGDVLPDLLAQCLSEAALVPTDIDEVACGVGPGSFTGIRIALSTALGFAFRRGLPVVGVSSLQAVHAHPALLAQRDRPRVVVQDALRGEVYLARLEPGEDLKAGIEGDVRRSLESIQDALAGAVVVAEGRAPCLEALPSGYLAMADHVSAAGIDALASLGGTVDPLPNYMRLSTPEELRAT